MQGWRDLDVGSKQHRHFDFAPARPAVLRRLRIQGVFARQRALLAGRLKTDLAMLLSYLGWVKTLAFQATAFSMMVGYRVADGLSTRSAQRI